MFTKKITSCIVKGKKIHPTMNSTYKKLKSEMDLKLSDPENGTNKIFPFVFQENYSNPKGLMVEVSL
jgi:hypothetical protein